MPQTITKFMLAQVQEANKRFAGLTRLQRCVAIAKDAIWQVQQKSIMPTSGNYFCRTSDYDETKAVCKGCAMACLFAGLADHKKIKGDKAESYFADSDIIPHMRDIDAFTRDELREIEAAFEGFADCSEKGWFDRHISYDADNNENDAERFLAIAANIIHNNGTFTPDKDPTPEQLQAIVEEATKTVPSV